MLADAINTYRPFKKQENFDSDWIIAVNDIVKPVFIMATYAAVFIKIQLHA